MDTRDNIKTKLNEVIDDTKVVENLEKNIYDYVIQYCKDNNIIQNFKNSNFKQLYIQKSRQIYFNLKKDSYVNNQQIHKSQVK
jgi:hypothetical protein